MVAHSNFFAILMVAMIWLPTFQVQAAGAKCEEQARSFKDSCFKGAGDPSREADLARRYKNLMEMKEEMTAAAAASSGEKRDKDLCDDATQYFNGVKAFNGQLDESCKAATKQCSDACGEEIAKEDQDLNKDQQDLEGVNAETVKTMQLLADVMTKTEAKTELKRTLVEKKASAYKEAEADTNVDPNIAIRQIDEQIVKVDGELQNLGKDKVALDTTLADLDDKNKTLTQQIQNRKQKLTQLKQTQQSCKDDSHKYRGYIGSSIAAADGTLDDVNEYCRQVQVGYSQKAKVAGTQPQGGGQKPGGGGSKPGGGGSKPGGGGSPSPGGGDPNSGAQPTAAQQQPAQPQPAPAQNASAPAAAPAAAPPAQPIQTAAPVVPQQQGSGGGVAPKTVSVSAAVRGPAAVSQPTLTSSSQLPIAIPPSPASNSVPHSGSGGGSAGGAIDLSMGGKRTGEVSAHEPGTGQKAGSYGGTSGGGGGGGSGGGHSRRYTAPSIGDMSATKYIREAQRQGKIPLVQLNSNGANAQNIGGLAGDAAKGVSNCRIEEGCTPANGLTNFQKNTRLMKSWESSNLLFESDDVYSRPRVIPAVQTGTSPAQHGGGI